MNQRKLWTLMAGPGLAVMSLLLVFFLLGRNTAGAAPGRSTAFTNLQSVSGSFTMIANVQVTTDTTNSDFCPLFPDPGIPVGLGGTRTFDVALGDADNDGDLDLAVGNHGPNVVYFNDGDGTFDTITRTFDGELTFDVDWGDLDNDGYLDLVVATALGRPNLVCHNNHGNSFTCEPFSFCSGLDTYDEVCSVALGDADGNGSLDIVLGTRYLENTFVPDVIYFNHGDGTFPITATTCYSNATLDLAFGNVDKDKDLDLAVVGHSPDYVCINNGSGVFTETRWLHLGEDRGTWCVALGDADGDGDLDIAAGEDFDKPLEIYLNDSQGNFPDRLLLGPASDVTYGLAWGDIDNDGDLDLVAGNLGQQDVIYFNALITATNGFTFKPMPIGPDLSYTTRVALGDVDGDCDLDLVVGSDGEQNLVYLNDLECRTPDTLSASQVGYRPQEMKRGVLLAAGSPPTTIFNVLADGQVAFTGALQEWGPIWGLNAWVADFSALTTPGYYHLKVGSITSPHFYIDPNTYRLLDPPDEIIAGAVFPDAIFDSFFAYQRSTEPDLNLPIYTLTITGQEVHTGITWPDASGGWNDAHTHDKETVSIAWTTQLLALALERNQAYFNVHPQTRQKILNEIQWGADWLFKMQDGDGGMLLAVKPEPPERRVLGNKGTGVTAKVAAALATAARVFANKNPALSTTYLNAAEQAWGWVQSHPDQFIPPTTYPGYWTGKSPSKILATVELYYAFLPTDRVKAQSYLTQAISFTLPGTFVVSQDCAWRDNSLGQTDSFRNAAIEEQTIVALARLYQAPHATSEVKTYISQELRKWYRECVTPAISTPYGIADGQLLTPWFGLNGWALQLGMDLLVAGKALDDENMIRTGQDHIQWVVGNNPFTTSYVVGVGERYPTDIWYKRPLTASIGAVLPGIFDEEPPGCFPDNEVTDPAEQWKLTEPVVWYTAAFLYDMAWLSPHRIYLPTIYK